MTELEIKAYGFYGCLYAEERSDGHGENYMLYYVPPTAAEKYGFSIRGSYLLKSYL